MIQYKKRSTGKEMSVRLGYRNRGEKNRRSPNARRREAVNEDKDRDQEKDRFKA